MPISQEQQLEIGMQMTEDLDTLEKDCKEANGGSLGKDCSQMSPFK